MEVVLTDDERSEIKKLMEGRVGIGIYKVYDGPDYCEIEKDNLEMEKANLIADKNILSREEIHAAVE